VLKILKELLRKAEKTMIEHPKMLFLRWNQHSLKPTKESEEKKPNKNNVVATYSHYMV